MQQVPICNKPKAITSWLHDNFLNGLTHISWITQVCVSKILTPVGQGWWNILNPSEQTEEPAAITALLQLLNQAENRQVVWQRKYRRYKKLWGFKAWNKVTNINPTLQRPVTQPLSIAHRFLRGFIRFTVAVQKTSTDSDWSGGRYSLI